MALALANRAGRLLGLHRTVSGSWLQGHLSTSAMLSQTSKSPSENDTKIYEMRTYYVKPKAFGKGKKAKILTSCGFSPREVSSGLELMGMPYSPLSTGLN